MATGLDDAGEMFCAALDMKEKKKALYEQSMKSCPDSDNFGRETFRMLRDAEEEHSRHIQEIYEEIKKGKAWEDACRYYPEHSDDLRSAFGKIVEEYANRPPVCADQVAAIDTGLQLEDAAIKFFESRLSGSTEAMERRFLQHMVVDEREHYRTLADLRFYYTDPEAWMMEKSRARLDGA